MLASASPRRLELLSLLEIPIVVAAAEVDETPLASESATAHTLRVAREKARTVARLRRDLPVLGADTVVVIGSEILGKPVDREDAARMLRALAGRTHTVLTAVCARWRGVEAEHLSASRVTFAAIDGRILTWYLETGDGDDKAGAYALQGRAAAFVERVEGNVQAVIGLPVEPLPLLFARLGLLLVPTAGLRPVSRRGVSRPPAR